MITINKWSSGWYVSSTDVWKFPQYSVTLNGVEVSSSSGFSRLHLKQGNLFSRAEWDNASSSVLLLFSNSASLGLCLKQIVYILLKTGPRILLYLKGRLEPLEMEAACIIFSFFLRKV